MVKFQCTCDESYCYDHVIEDLKNILIFYIGIPISYYICGRCRLNHDESIIENAPVHTLIIGIIEVILLVVGIFWRRPPKNYP